MKQIYFGGRYFELVTNEKQCVRMICAFEDGKNNTSIYDCYIKPSENKKRIMANWQYWCLNNECEMPRIVSFSCQYMSIAFRFTYMGSQWLAYIKPTHKYAFPI